MSEQHVILGLRANLKQLGIQYNKVKDKNKRLRDCLDEIEAVSCGEYQVAEWIYKRIQTLKKGE